MKALFNISIFFICFSFFACSSSKDQGKYLDERPKAEIAAPSDVNIEVKVVNPDSTSVEGMKVSVITSLGQETVITNQNGIAQLTVQRAYSEPLTFRFQKSNMEMSETIRTLPSDLKFAGLVFEVLSPNRIKLSHYTVDGLYR